MTKPGRMKTPILHQLVIAPLLISLAGCNTSSGSGQPAPSSTPEAKEQLATCEANLKALGTAMDEYSSANEGHYPKDLTKLTPDYLKVIPNCPVSKAPYIWEDGADFEYNDGAYQDYYFFQCKGGVHAAAGLQGDFPAYDAITGIIKDQKALDTKKEAHKQSQP